jgi:hypothetical protein
MGNLSHLEYRTDRAARNTFRCAARALGLTPRALLALPRGELRQLIKRARRRAEKEWHEASLRLDAVVGLEDAISEGRL